MEESRRDVIRRSVSVLFGFGLCLAGLGWIVPVFAEVYSSVDMPLPAHTVHVLQWGQDFSMAPPLFIGLAILASWGIGRKGALAHALAWAGFLLFALFSIYALYLPIVVPGLQGIGGDR